MANPAATSGIGKDDDAPIEAGLLSWLNDSGQVEMKPKVVTAAEEGSGHCKHGESGEDAVKR